jgi:hypothetical protein
VDYWGTRRERARRLTSWARVRSRPPRVDLDIEYGDDEYPTVVFPAVDRRAVYERPDIGARWHVRMNALTIRFRVVTPGRMFRSDN